jgi:hypothetical protein
MNWNEPPEIMDAENALKGLAKIRGEILREKRNIQKLEDGLKSKYPRKPELRRNELETEYDRLMELEVLELSAIADIDFINMRVKMWQTYSYKKA